MITTVTSPLQRVGTALNVVRWERSDRVLSECAGSGATEYNEEVLIGALGGGAQVAGGLVERQQLRPSETFAHAKEGMAVNRPHECQRSSITLCMLAYRFEKLFRERVKVLSFCFRRLAFRKQSSLPRIPGIDVELIQTVQHIEVNVNLG
jgi:hypothetical protein